MLTKAAVLLLAVAATLCLFTFHIARRSAKLLDEITQLRHTNAALQKRADDVEALMRRLNRLEAQMNEAEIKDAAAARAPQCTPSHPKLSTITTSTARPAAATNSTADDMSAATLLSVHSTWDWRSIVDNYLRPWPTISYEQLDSAVAACNGSAMYCQRFQVHDGKLYITDYAAIFFDRHYAPARVLPLLDTLRRHPQLRNLDIVVAGNDEPRVHNVPGDPRLWRRSCQRYCGDGSSTSDGRAPPALFSSTTNRATLDLPWLDFAWFFPKRPHKLRTPPWSVLHPQLLAAGRSVPWATKVELAMHTGNVGSTQRKLLAAVAQGSPDTMLVNELFIGDHNTIRKRCVELGLHRTGGYQKHRCFMTFEDQCSYKYLLNSASIGYANKFKSLLLCGSVVLYVRDGMRHQEFYEHGLLAGVHYVAVDRASDVPAMVRWLQKNDEYARAVAHAGRARMASLDARGLSDFMLELLSQYSKRLMFPVRPQPGAVHIECEDDLWRHYALSRPWLESYLTRDNTTCVHPPDPGTKLGPPGWGGAYRGSKPRCYASHDQSPGAQPHACDFAEPFSTAESWEPDGMWPRAHPKSDRWDSM